MHLITYLLCNLVSLHVCVSIAYSGVFLPRVACAVGGTLPNLNITVI